jgi:soluble lytic murein transglycosylase-like protein
MPGTASTYGVADAFEPSQNVDGGCAYLHDLLARYRGDLTLALAAYNAGPGAVDKYGGVPPFAETQSYVRNVTALYREASAPARTRR